MKYSANYMVFERGVHAYDADTTKWAILRKDTDDLWIYMEAEWFAAVLAGRRRDYELVPISLENE